MTFFAYVLGAVFTASFLAVVWLCVADGVRAALRIRRAAHADDAFAQDAPPKYVPVPDVLAALDKQFSDLPPDYFQRLQALYLTPQGSEQ